MVRFEKDRFTIEIRTGGEPVETWTELYKELFYLVGLVNQDNTLKDGLVFTPQLLDDMMPAWETARRMLP